MGVPMVQNKSRRRSGLIMGTLLALLLGGAAGFVVFVMPVRMLETITTLSRLSKLMVQAEPPISPNDRTLLAVLAGILASGIGWVLLDWFVFGRAGLNKLIRTRDDDFEDEGDDHFRPVDPLDLVVPAMAGGDGRASSSPGSALRPLSALTDIGNPPSQANIFGAPVLPGSPPSIGILPTPGVNQPLPPIDQILPGAPLSAPPLQPSTSFGLLQSIVAPPSPQGHPGGPPGDGGLPASWPPLEDLPAKPPVPAPHVATPEIAAKMPSWLPAPGARTVPVEETDKIDVFPVPNLPEPAPTTVAPQPASPLLTPQLAATPPFEAPLLAPAAPIAVIPAVPDSSARAPDVNPLPAPPATAAEPALPHKPVLPEPAQLSLRQILSQPSLDHARVESLLDRLERGLLARRAVATDALPASASASAPGPVPTPSHPEPPTAYAAQPPIIPQPAALHDAPVQWPVPPLSTADGDANDEMLDQPLYLTLDRLRNRVKR